MNDYREFRCEACGKVLMEYNMPTGGHIRKRCPKCGRMNILTVVKQPSGPSAPKSSEPKRSY
jgi:phage FluMu protein Com